MNDEVAAEKRGWNEWNGNGMQPTEQQQTQKTDDDDWDDEVMR